MHRRIVFPFTAIVGMDLAKKALLAVAVNPLIGGVLLRGDKGTGKTTLVRGLANVLPEIQVVADCPFNCNPFNPLEMCDNCYRRWKNGENLPIIKRGMRVIDLPLSITPDRLIGTLDIEKALKEGVKALKPGILDEANRNILYIDEVNLLDDYIADLILDAAAYGWNIIEREHVSFKHPARFILVGSMNPEEGELRPQLLDRFGLVVNVEAPMDPDLRAEIVKRVEEYSIDPITFYKKYQSSEEELRKRIIRAKEILPMVTVDEDLVKMLAKTLVDMKIKTCRAEITTIRTAKALAALAGRTYVTLDDLRDAMKLALPHKTNLTPFNDLKNMGHREDRHIGKHESNRDHRRNHGNHEDHVNRTSPVSMKSNELSDLMREGTSSINIPPSSNELKVDEKLSKSTRNEVVHHRGSKYAYQTTINKPFGIPVSYVFSIPNPIDIDIVGTIANAAVNRVPMEKVLSNGLLQDVLAVRIRRSRVPSLVIIVLDASGSMNVLKRIAIAKRIAWEIIEKSYTKRAWLSLITFRGNGIDKYIPITKRYSKVLEILKNVPTGGKTPLTAGLKKVIETAKIFRTKYPSAYVKAILITDGKANKPLYMNIEDEIKYYSSQIRRENIDLIIYDTRPGLIDPSISYIDKISYIADAKVYRL